MISIDDYLTSPTMHINYIFSHIHIHTRIHILSNTNTNTNTKHAYKIYYMHIKYITYIHIYTLNKFGIIH